MAKATKTAVVAAVACLLIGAGAAVRLSGHSAPARATPPVETADTATHAAARSRRGGAPDAESPAPAAEDAKPFARGIVVDEADAPIAGCRVLVRGHEDMGGIQDAPVRLDATAAAVTGADGRFVVPKRPDDLASLTFVADGYEAVEERSFDADLRVVLAASASFGATVVDTAGEPIAGADVRVMGAWLKSEPRWSCVWLRAATDAAGRFKFRSLPQDARLTWISKWGYRLPGPEMGALPEQDVYVLERSCLIVDVTDATTQEPIPDARAVLVRPDGALLGNLEPQPAIASTRARAGRLFWSRHPRIGDVAAELRVFAPGHRVRSMPLAFAADAEPPLLALALDPGEDAPMLAGRVAEGAGALVEARFTPRIDGTRIVYGTDLQLPIAAAATVAADGTFRITGIPAGAYRLTVTRPGEVPLAIDVEAPATSIELRFGPKAALTVRYVDTSGRAVSGAWIHVESPGTNVAWCVCTDASGVAAFDALPAAEVVAIPMHNTGILLQRGGVAGLSGFQPLPAEIRVLAAGQRESMVLTRPDPCRVSVVVRDDAGRPVPNVEIHAKAVYGFAFWLAEERDRLPLLDLSTDAEGRATFDVLPCRGEVKALRQGRVNTAEFVADVGSSPTVEIVLPSVTGVIRGRVLERGSGAPVVARPVKVWWDNKVIAESATGDDGRFTASGVPPGRVRVLVEGYSDANDAQGRRVDPKSPYGSAEKEFEMAAGEDHSVALTLPRIKGKEAERTAAVVEATIVDAAGAPVAGSWMAVRGLVDGAWCSLGDARAGDDGRARLEVVAAERYRVRAWSGDRSAEVERDPAPSLTERLVLAPK